MNKKMQPVRMKDIKRLWGKIKRGNHTSEQFDILEDWMERLLSYYKEKMSLKDSVIKSQYEVLDDYRRDILKLELENDRLREKLNKEEI